MVDVVPNLTSDKRLLHLHDVQKDGGYPGEEEEGEGGGEAGEGVGEEGGGEGGDEGGALSQQVPQPPVDGPAHQLAGEGYTISNW